MHMRCLYSYHWSGGAGVTKIRKRNMKTFQTFVEPGVYLTSSNSAPNAPAYYMRTRMPRRVCILIHNIRTIPKNVLDRCWISKLSKICTKKYNKAHHAPDCCGVTYTDGLDKAHNALECCDITRMLIHNTRTIPKNIRPLRNFRITPNKRKYVPNFMARRTMHQIAAV
jgi:hypothetical protein